MRRIESACILAIAAAGCESLTGTSEQRSPVETVIAHPHPRAARMNPAPPTRTRDPAPTPLDPSARRDRPHFSLDAIAADALCVTRGSLEQRAIRVPTFRAVALGHAGDAAAMRVVVHGASAKARALASGQERRQLGLKLRAQDGCNLVYVMWRLDPKPKLDVSVKHNPGDRTAKECGAGGYIKVKPAKATKYLPTLDDGTEHELRAEIIDDSLYAWIDGSLAWQGRLPTAARELAGPAGVRSDNLDFELTAFDAADRQDTTAPAPKCVVGDDTD